MKFYYDKYSNYYINKVYDNKTTCVYMGYSVEFFYKGMNHNIKNAAISEYYHIGKAYYLYSKYYGNEDDFTKKTWRKFCKLKTFL